MGVTVRRKSLRLWLLVLAQVPGTGGTGAMAWSYAARLEVCEWDKCKMIGFLACLRDFRALGGIII